MNDWHQTLGPVLSSDAPLSRAGMIGATVCLVWAAGLAGWCSLKLRRRRSDQRRLLRCALERGFSRDEAMNLWRLGRYAEGGRRETILDSREAFDLCVRAAEKAAGDEPVLWPEYLAGSVTSALGRKYGVPRRARRRIADTHEIELNQPVHVRLADGTVFASFVLHVTDEGLELSVPGGVEVASGGPANCPAFVSFWRPHDARYDWTSRVIGQDRAAGAAERRLGVAHAPLNRVQEREFVRVRCRQEIHFGTPRADGRPEPPEMPFTAMLHDLSNGGASFVTDKPIAAGTRLLLRIQLARKPWSLTLPAQLLRQNVLEGTSNRSWHSSVRFEPMTSRTENHLNRFVADLQRRLIARMLSRAGADEPDAAESIAEAGIEQESPVWTRPTEPPADASFMETGPNAAASGKRGPELETAQRSRDVPRIREEE